MAPINHADTGVARNPGSEEPCDTLRLLVEVQPDTLDRHADDLTGLGLWRRQPRLQPSQARAGASHGPSQGMLNPLKTSPDREPVEYGRLR
jgi:hypothetical protein